MKLSIITINFNNTLGLQKTMESVFAQTSKDFEYIVVDGGSTDESKDIICQYANMPKFPFTWISEIDNGIYQAMNKGVKLAKGEFVQFLNSGDCLVAADVTERMLNYLENQKPRAKSQELRINNQNVNASDAISNRKLQGVSSFSPPSGESEGASILYGNMLKQLPGRILRDRGFSGRMPTMLDFYTGTLNHSPAYIKRNLFETYGLYDESLRIVADWKWNLQVIVLNGVVPVYKDMDVTLFDMNGISNVNSKLDKAERKHVLAEIFPVSVLADYERWAFPIDQMKRINRYWITRNGFWLVERVLFKWEKWFRNKEQVF